jgi:Ribbon-helix-helix domain
MVAKISEFPMEKHTTVTMSSDMLQRLKDRAQRDRISVSELLRRGAEIYLAGYVQVGQEAKAS